MSKARILLTVIAKEGHGSNKHPTTLEAYTNHGRYFARPTEPLSQGLLYPGNGGIFTLNFRQFPYETCQRPIRPFDNFNIIPADTDTSIKAGVR
jgi:hypothetical protein